MKTEGDAHLLRIFVNESDRFEGRPLYEMVIRAAKEKGLSGATALRGIEGFGASGRVHSVKVLHLSEDVPIVVEILDSVERIAVFLPVLDQMVNEGAVTLEKVHLISYRRDERETAAVEFEDELQLDVEEPTPAAAAKSAASKGREDFTDRAHQIIVEAKELATESRRVNADSVDVLLAMLGETRGFAASALKTLGLDCKAVERALRDSVSRDDASTKYLKALTARSTAASKWLGDEYTGAEHLLLALCQMRPSIATDILTRLGAQPRDICHEVLNMTGHDGDWQGWLADHPEL